MPQVGNIKYKNKTISPISSGTSTVVLDCENHAMEDNVVVENIATDQSLYEINVAYNNQNLISVSAGRELSLDCNGHIMAHDLHFTTSPYAKLEITAPTGSTVYIQKGSTRIDATESSGKWNFVIPEFGVWVANVSKSGFSNSENVNIEVPTIYRKTMSQYASWSSGTDEQILAMIQADHRGEINLRNYWNVGDMRTVQLNAIPATGADYSVGESQPEQTIELVLMDTTCKGITWATTPQSGNTVPRFIVGQKDCLYNKGYMYATAPASNIVSRWMFCDRRDWCNYGYREAFSNTVKSWFEQFKWTHASQSPSSGAASIDTTSDYFGLPTEMNVFGRETYSNEQDKYSRWSWYATSANRVKKWRGENSSWWGSSAYYTTVAADRKEMVYNDVSNVQATEVVTTNLGIAPFGCI